MANLSSYLPGGIDPAAVTITGGSINGTTIGASTPSTGAFTTFTSTGIDDNATSTAITIDSSQNVGIGATSPGAPLQVGGASAGDAALWFSTSGTSYSEIESVTFGFNYNMPLVLQRQGGNVGIGTASPADNLTLFQGTGTFGVRLQNTATGTTANDGVAIQLDGTTNGLNLWTYDFTDMRFGTANSERMRILSSGGLTFNGDTAAANALDDYEEGTWTPYYGGSTLSGVSYINQYGFYTKIGNVVTATFRVVTTGTFTAGSSTLYVAGLPFNAASSTGSEGTLSVHDATRWSSNPPIVGRVLGGSDSINIYYDFDATGAGTDPQTVLESDLRNASGNNNTLQGTIVYRT